MHKVVVRTHLGSLHTCYDNVYGINPGKQNGGAYPSLGACTNGRQDPDDFCMGVPVLGLPGEASNESNGFVNTGNSFDGPQRTEVWPNKDKNTTTAFSVWVQ